MTILECEGRPAQAGMFGMKVLRQALKMKTVGPELLEAGKRCLKMLVMSGNVKMTGSCLTIMIFLLIKHFETIALGEGLNIYQDYVGHVSDDVKELIRTVLHALNERDFDKIEEIKKNDTLLKTDKDIKELIEDVLTNIHERAEVEVNAEEKTTRSPSAKIIPGDGRRMKDLSTVLALASGAALVASSVTATKTKLGSSRRMKDVWDVNKEAGPYSDVTGFEHVQPHSVGRYIYSHPASEASWVAYQTYTGL